MKIIVDAFGGDNAPIEIIKGAISASEKYNLDILFTGDEQKIKDVINEYSLDDKRVEIVNTTELITMHDEPVKAVRSKKDSSLVVGAKLLKEGKGDAYVSAGSTGALLTAATLVVGRINGIKRPALATVIPTAKGASLLLDCGANVDCKPEYLQQFAVMGSVYAAPMLGITNPTVGLLNNGTEDSKGTDVHKQANELMKTTEHINYIGNIEGKEYVMGGCDVLVADGFSGNVFLKTMEGTAKMIMKEIKGIFLSSLKNKLAALVVKGSVNDLKKKMDASEYGGAPLLGICKPVIKAHGNSDAKGFESAVRQAMNFVNAGIVETIEKSMSKTEIDS